MIDDARKLVPLAQKMVDVCIPIAEEYPEEGNFTITVKVNRKNGKALCDINVALRK